MNDVLINTYNITFENLKFAEAKNGIIVAFNGTMIIALLNIICSDQITINKYLNLYLILICFFSILSLSLSLLSFLPILKIPIIFFKKNETGRDNMLFFGSIRKYDEEQLLSKLFPEKNSFEQYQLDYATQIIIISKITYRKYHIFKISLSLLIFGVLTVFFVLLMLALRKQIINDGN